MPAEFKRTAFESDLAAAMEADVITVIQHSRGSSRFAHAGAFTVFGYNIHEGIIVPTTTTDAPPDYGNCYMFLHPNEAQAVQEHTESGLIKEIVFNQEGVSEVVRDTIRNRRKFMKKGIVARSFCLPEASRSLYRD